MPRDPLRQLSRNKLPPARTDKKLARTDKNAASLQQQHR